MEYINAATVYRFYTPLFDFDKERNLLFSIFKKVEKSLEYDWVIYEKQVFDESGYKNIVYKFEDDLWEITIKYISNFYYNYYKPIFILDIKLHNYFFILKYGKEGCVKFLNNIFECFDWLNEKEFLIDINNKFNFKKSFFSRRVFPSHNFYTISNLSTKNIIKELEKIIWEKSKNVFILTNENSEDYHRVNKNLVYYCYIIYLMYLSINEANKILSVKSDNSYIDLYKKRLKYINNLNLSHFDNYNDKLTMFFNLFNRK